MLGARVARATGDKPIVAAVYPQESPDPLFRMDAAWVAFVRGQRLPRSAPGRFGINGVHDHRRRSASTWPSSEARRRDGAGRREVPGALSAGVGLTRRNYRFAIASVALLAVLAAGWAALGAEHSEDRAASAGNPFDRPETGEPDPQRRPVAPSSPAAAAVSRDLAASRSSAREFLTGYLALLHGRGSTRALVHVAPALQRELRRTRPRVTPTQQQTRTEILHLNTALRSPGSVRALATVRERGGPPYPLALYLERRGSRWVVTRIGDA